MRKMAGLQEAGGHSTKQEERTEDWENVARGSTRRGTRTAQNGQERRGRKPRGEVTKKRGTQGREVAEKAREQKSSLGREWCEDSGHFEGCHVAMSAVGEQSVVAGSRLVRER